MLSASSVVCSAASHPLAALSPPTLRIRSEKTGSNSTQCPSPSMTGWLRLARICVGVWWPLPLMCLPPTTTGSSSQRLLGVAPGAVPRGYHEAGLRAESGVEHTLRLRNQVIDDSGGNEPLPAAFPARVRCVCRTLKRVTPARRLGRSCLACRVHFPPHHNACGVSISGHCPRLRAEPMCCLCPSAPWTIGHAGSSTACCTA